MLQLFTIVVIGVCHFLNHFVLNQLHGNGITIFDGHLIGELHSRRQDVVETAVIFRDCGCISCFDWKFLYTAVWLYKTRCASSSQLAMIAAGVLAHSCARMFTVLRSLKLYFFPASVNRSMSRNMCFLYLYFMLNCCLYFVLNCPGPRAEGLWLHSEGGT